MSINSDMDAAIIALATANERLATAQTRVSEARRDECTALNVVNEAQKRLDQLVAQLRTTASRDTDWGRARNPGIPVE